MADVLSSGPESGPRPRRRWTTPLAGLLVAATATVLAVRTGGADDTADLPRATGPSVVVRPAPTPARTGPPPPAAVFRLDGVPGPGPPGRLLVGGREPGVLDTATGRLTSLAGLLEAPGDRVTFEHRGGLTVALVKNPNQLRPRGAVLTGGKVVDLGPLLALLPMRDGTVLTEDCAGGGGTGPCVLTSRTVTGGTRWTRSVSRQLDLVRDTPYGLLVRAYQGDLGGVARLEDPRTGKPVRIVGRTYAVLAATDEQVLFRRPDCDSDCPLRLAELSGTAWRELPPGSGRAVTAAFAPDGRIAIAYAGLSPVDNSPSTERDGYVAVIDLTAGRMESVPGVGTVAASTPLPVWAPDGRLLVAVSDDGVGRLAAWRFRDEQVTVLPVRLHGLWGEPGMVAGIG